MPAVSGDLRAGQTCDRAPTGGRDHLPHDRVGPRADWDRLPKPYLLVNHDHGLRGRDATNGHLGDPTRPTHGCTRMQFVRLGCIDAHLPLHGGYDLGYHTAPRELSGRRADAGRFGELADDDMCNMFGYFIKQSDAATLP